MAKKRLILLIVFIIVVLLVIFLPGYAKLQDLIAESKRLEKRIGDLQESIENLIKEKKQLESDITYIEKIAREKMGVVKKGEKKIERGK